MTIALSLGSGPAMAPNAPTRSSASEAAFDFGGLLKAEIATQGGPGSQKGAVSLLASLEVSGSGVASTLEDLLAGLTEKLETLETGLKEGAAPENEMLGALEGLMKQIETLLGQPGGQGETARGDLLNALPDKARTTLGDLFERGAQLANRLGGQFEEGAPQTAEKLGGFARFLDEHAAALRPAQATEAADTLKKIAHSQARPESIAPDTEAPVEKRAEAALERTAQKTLTGQAASAATQNGQTGQNNAGQQQGGHSGGAQAALAAAVTQTEGKPRPDQSFEALLNPGTNQTQNATQTGAPQANPQAPARPNPINMPFVGAEIARHVNNGNSRFEIRLNPPELGRVEVKLDIDKGGNVTARLAIERSETLDLMQRDQRTLERALAQSGLDTGKTSLEFSLQQGGQDGQQQGEQGDGDTPRFDAPSAQEAEPEPVPQTLYRGNIRPDAVNLWI